MPVVGTYRTHFQELNQRGAARDELGRIDQSLPVIRDVIDAQAEAVAAAAAACLRRCRRINKARRRWPTCSTRTSVCAAIGEPF